jgi:hypothetical protein
MTERTDPGYSASVRSDWEARLVVGSAALLSGLALADRLAAWLIGEFPTSAALWQLRFEFLRPIGVFYDIVEFNFGTLSPMGFSALVVIAAALVAGGTLSRIRLARALSCHVLLGLAALLLVYSLNYGWRTYATVGRPSEFYAILGATLVLAAVGLCLRIHAEYVGWKPSSSRALARMRAMALKLDRRLTDLLEEFSVPQASRQAAPLLLRVVSRKPRR